MILIWMESNNNIQLYDLCAPLDVFVYDET